MPKPVTHRISYKAEIEKTDTYTKMYEQYLCGLSKRFIKDEPLTDEERAKLIRQKRYQEKHQPVMCKTCEKVFNKARGE